MPSVTLIALALIGLLYGISTIFGPAKLVAAISLIVSIAALFFFVKRQNSIDDPLVYMPAILGSALAIGPVQSFALFSLPRTLNPHGVTIFSTSFQVAGCVGTALSTGIYGAFVASGNGTDVTAANRGFLVVGVVLFVLAAIAVVLGWTGTRATTTSDAPAQTAESPASDMLVAKLMRQDIYALSPEATIREALHLFVDKRISGAPLLDRNSKLAGFVSDGDVLDVIGDSVPAFTTPYALLAHNESEEFETDVAAVLDRPVASIATKSVITGNVHDDLGHISSVLADKHLKKAPVVAEDGTVVGIINRSDINRYLVATFVPVSG